VVVRSTWDAEIPGAMSGTDVATISRSRCVTCGLGGTELGDRDFAAQQQRVLTWPPDDCRQQPREQQAETLADFAGQQSRSGSVCTIMPRARNRRIDRIIRRPFIIAYCNAALKLTETPPFAACRSRIETSFLRLGNVLVDQDRVAVGIE
jgi:hypothetical protein